MVGLVGCLLPAEGPGLQELGVLVGWGEGVGCKCRR